MKKILTFLTLLNIATPTSWLTQACGSGTTPSAGTYDNPDAAIAAMNLNSYIAVGKRVTDVVTGLQVDVLKELFKVNFAAPYVFTPKEFSRGLDINQAKLINKGTNALLADSDLVAATTLQLDVTVTSQGIDTHVASCTLNVMDQTDQDISDYIKSFDFNAFFQGPQTKKQTFIGFNMMLFPDFIKSAMVLAVGSYGTTYMDNDASELDLTGAQANGKDITQTALNTIGNLNLKVAYQYNNLTEETVNFTISLDKYDISVTSLINFPSVTVTLNAATNDNLTDNDVTEIINAIKDQIFQAWQNLDVLITTPSGNYEVTGLEDTVKMGADFSTAPISVPFNIVADSSSAYLTGTLTNQVINVTVNNP